MRRINRAIAMGMVAMMLFSGCEKAPEESIVKQKSMDNMIKKAEDSTNGSDDVASVTDNYTKYENKFENKKLGVYVKADAKVEIPNAKKLSVYRVKRGEISEKLINNVKDALGLDEQMYHGNVLDVRTKEQIAAEIQGCKNNIEEIKKSDDSEKSKKVMISEENYRIDELKKKYKHSGNTVDWDKYKGDIKLESVKNLCDKFKNDNFYDWEKTLNSDGEVMYFVNKGDKGTYKEFYAQNNSNLGNCIRYYSGKNVRTSVYYADMGSYYSTQLDIDDGMWEVGTTPSAKNTNHYGDEDDYFSNIFKYIKEFKNEEVKISQEDARKKVDDFMTKVGLADDFGCVEQQLVYEQLDDFVDEKAGKSSTGARKVYHFKFLRQIDGVQINNENGNKFADSGSGADYTKKEWSGEAIDFVVNDEGIVGFQYNSPLKITDTVVKKSNLMKFDKIKKIFEDMIITTNAADTEGKKTNIKVEEVKLRYMRVSEENSFETGLLVPVWEFNGTKRDNITGSKAGSTDVKENLMTINGIDGTVVDQMLGY